MARRPFRPLSSQGLAAPSRIQAPNQPHYQVVVQKTNLLWWMLLLAFLLASMLVGILVSVYDLNDATQNSIRELKVEQAELKDEHRRLNDKLSALTGRVNGLESRVNGLEQSIGEAQKDIKLLGLIQLGQNDTLGTLLDAVKLAQKRIRRLKRKFKEMETDEFPPN